MDTDSSLRKSDLELQELKQNKRSSGSPDRGKITPLKYNDLEEVAEMSQVYFPRSKEVSISYLTHTLKELYFRKNKKTQKIASLVSRSKEGSIDGFLGVTSHYFLFREHKITVANCHHLMATEKARSRLIPMRLLQQFLSGPQDLSFADGSVESTRLLWKRLGGQPCIAHSLYYKVPLRPASFALRPFLKQMKVPVNKIVNFMATGVDAVAGAVRLPMFHRSRADVQLKPLTASLLLISLEKISSRYSVFPEYNLPEIEHLFQLLGNETRYGTLHKTAILDKEENVTGWFIYYVKKRGICEVIQAVAVPGKEKILFDTLTWHAYNQGGIELSGRLMASHLQSSFTTKAVCLPARMWTLIHSSDPGLMLEIQSGNAFITRLEGDLWVL